jgi:hypothetical protein
VYVPELMIRIDIGGGVIEMAPLFTAKPNPGGGAFWTAAFENPKKGVTREVVLLATTFAVGFVQL